MINLQIIDKRINEIKPYEKNPRKNDEAVKYVAESIKQFGFKVPIIIDKDDVIVCGHTRYKAAKKLNMDTVPCIMADDLTDEQIKAFRLADNKVSEKAEWDFDLLGEEISDLINFDMTDFGFEDILSEEDSEHCEAVEDDFNTENSIDENTQPITNTGDIWQLGRHRLMCGDSTDKACIDKLMDGKKADLVFTDPPYGMKKENDGVANDNLNYDDLLEFNKKWIPLTFEALKENGSWYCWGIDEPLMDIYSHILKPMIKQNKITFRNLITWDKGNGIGQMSGECRMYPIADEKCLFVMCGVQEYNTNSDNYYEGFEPVRQYLCNEWAKLSDRNNWKDALNNGMGLRYFTKSQWVLPTEENYSKLQQYANGKAFLRDYDELREEFEKIKKDYDKEKQAWYETRAYFNNTHDNMNNMWHFNRTSGEEREGAGGHATPKPIALCGRAIKSSSRENENVLDVFGGSGSTLIACEQLNRNAYLIELEPKWCDVIIKRWENYTGQKAKKIEL